MTEVASASVLERVVLFHDQDETTMAVACANAIAAATGVPVALDQPGDQRVRWWLHRPRTPLSEPPLP